jgi:hypothetical protein
VSEKAKSGGGPGMFSSKKWVCVKQLSFVLTVQPSHVVALAANVVGF